LFLAAWVPRARIELQQAEVGCIILGILGDSAVEVGLRFPVVMIREEDLAKLREHVRSIRGQCLRLLQFMPRILEMAHHPRDAAQIVVCVCRGRFVSGCLFQP
jgi:hypothetical protein